MILFGSNLPLDLTGVPFTRKGAFVSVYQNPQDGKLYLSHLRSEPVGNKRPNLMELSFMRGAETLPFWYESDEAVLTVHTPKGVARFTYDGEQILRVQLEGISLRVTYEPEMHEGADVRAADELEVGLNFLGKLLFKGIAGEFTTNARWNFREVRPFPFIVDVTPGADGKAELAIHEYYTSGLPNETYRPFDVCAADSRAEFEAYISRYSTVPKIWNRAARIAAWVVWSHTMGPRGSITEPILYMHKLLLVRTFVWHHSFAALSALSDVKAAWQFLLAFFQFRGSKYGGLPDHSSDQMQSNWVSTKPPLFGYPLCQILDERDTSALTRADYQRAWDMLKPYREWRFRHHDHAGTGFPAYYHVDESGYDEATLFEAGLPLISPDLIAYMILLDEGLSKLADRLNLPSESAFHRSESARLLDFLVNVLWDGEQFRAKVVKTGELYACGCAAQLQPILLGKRLPQRIIDRIKERVLDETEYLTPYGVTSENMKSPRFCAMSFTRGPVIAPVNCLIASGLYDAGEAEAAREIAGRYLQAMAQYGPVLGASSVRVDPLTFQQLPPYEKGPIGSPLTPWAASIFLYMAEISPRHPYKCLTNVPSLMDYDTERKTIMKIAVIGATGKAGALIAKEAADRGHEVTAIVRDQSKLTDKRYSVLSKDIFDIAPEDVKGYDAVVSAYGTGFDPESAKGHVKAGEHLIGVFSQTPDVRLLIVGGAASLYTDPKKKHRVLEAIPPEWRPVPENQAKVLEALKASTVKWTFFSPAGLFDANGGRTGTYTPGTDFALKNASGENYISYADYAVAMVDAIESGEHVGVRFTAVSDRKPKDKDAYYGIEKKKPTFEGISRYKPPFNFELAGKQFHILMDFGRDIDVEFVSGTRLIWKQGDDPAYDTTYECAKGAALCYFINFEPKQIKPRTGITLIADLQTNLVTVCYAKTRFHQLHPTLVQTTFDFGAIEVDGVKPGKKRHGYTTDLVGKRIHWKYAPEWSIIHVYYHPYYMRGTFTPDMIARMEQSPEQREGWEGNPYDERTNYIKLRDGLYLIECSEHSMARRDVPGNSLLFLMDTRRVHDVGRSFGHTGQFGGEGYLPENYLFGAFGEFVESDGTVESSPPFYQI